VLDRNLAIQQLRAGVAQARVRVEALRAAQVYDDSFGSGQSFLMDAYQQAGTELGLMVCALQRLEGCADGHVR
jgi:hypothetical protein